MAKIINITSVPAKRIHVTSTPQPKISHAEFAAAMGAEPIGERLPRSADPITLAELGAQLIQRLRSTGGRPALADATERCKVPLSAGDIAALEEIVRSVERETGLRPSLGQIAGIILHMHLEPISGNPAAPAQKTEAELSVTVLDDLIEQKLKPIRAELARLAKRA